MTDTKIVVNVILLMYEIDDQSCILPFVKYVSTKGELPSFLFEYPENDDLFLKNECFRRVFHFLSNIHGKQLDFPKGTFLSQSKSKSDSKVYFLCNVSGRLNKNTEFLLERELKGFEYPLIKQKAYPNAYYCCYNDNGKRYDHPQYGDFFYFSTIRPTNPTVKYAVFDCFVKENTPLEETEMFMIDDSTICVKNLLHFVEI